LLGSNQAIPRPGSLFQQKVIAKVIAKLKHLDDQERKRQRTWNKKQVKNKRKKKEGTRKGNEEERTNQKQGNKTK